MSILVTVYLSSFLTDYQIAVNLLLSLFCFIPLSIVKVQIEVAHAGYLEVTEYSRIFQLTILLGLFWLKKKQTNELDTF